MITRVRGNRTVYLLAAVVLIFILSWLPLNLLNVLIDLDYFSLVKFLSFSIYTPLENFPCFCSIWNVWICQIIATACQVLKLNDSTFEILMVCLNKRLPFWLLDFWNIQLFATDAHPQGSDLCYRLTFCKLKSKSKFRVINQYFLSPYKKQHEEAHCTWPNPYKIHKGWA